MALLGNIIWLMTSFYVPLCYLLGGIILFPLLPFLWPAIKYSFLPFSWEIVSIKYLKSFREKKENETNFERASPLVRFLGNVVWVFTFGWLIALAHFLAAVFNLLICALIITIPFALPNVMAHIKLIPVAFIPFGRKLISKELGKKLRNVQAEKDYKKLI
jgi:uncharacterized membrane protein YccF (DUF307 family)